MQALAAPWNDFPLAAAPAADATIRLALLPVLKPRPFRLPTAATEEGGIAAPLGRAVHRLLEWIGRPDRPLPRDRWAAAAAAAAGLFGLAPARADEVLAVARRVLDSPECAAFFDPVRLAWAGNEVPVAFEGAVLRLDRLVALHGEPGPCWWVLDYKLSGQPEADPALVAQLRRYRQAVGLLQPGDRVRAAFITGAGRLIAIGD